MIIRILVGCLFKSNERSEDSYIGLADFFCSGKVLKVSDNYR